MVIFYKKQKKYDETQLTKNKIDLNNRKMTNYPPSPGPFSTAIGNWEPLHEEFSPTLAHENSKNEIR